MPSLLDQSAAVVVWAFSFALFYRRRWFYIAFLVILLFAAGFPSLVIAPTLWLPAEVLDLITSLFRVRAGRGLRKQL